MFDNDNLKFNSIQISRNILRINAKFLIKLDMLSANLKSVL